jgi:hypothetical protein
VRTTGTGKADDQEQRLDRLEAWTRERYPSLGTVERRWSGMVYEPVDFAAYIGRNHGNRHVYVATGDSGQGMTNSVAAGLIVRDLVMGRQNAFAEVHDPTRISPSVVGEFVKDNLAVAGNLTEYVTRGDVGSLDEIRAGSGAVVRQGLAKVAPTAMRRASCTCARRCARMRAASCTGTTSRSAGTAPATAPTSPRTAACSKVRPSRPWHGSTRPRKRLAPEGRPAPVGAGALRCVSARAHDAIGAASG